MSEHGTRTRYKEGCRCRSCTAAQSYYNAQRYKLSARRNPQSVNLRTAHGTDARYQKGCRCDLCKATHNRYQRLLRRRNVEDRKCVPGLGWPIGPGDPAGRKALGME